MSKITKVSYSRLSFLGDYDNERIELEATLEDGDEWDKVLEDLREKVLSESEGVEEYKQFKRGIQSSKEELNELLEKLEKTRLFWESICEFVESPDIKRFPVFPNFIDEQIAQKKSNDDDIPI